MQWVAISHMHQTKTTVGQNSFLAFIKLSVFAADKIGGGPGAVVVSILLTQAGGQKGNYPGPPN